MARAINALQKLRAGDGSYLLSCGFRKLIFVDDVLPSDMALF
jgi:hypothetical protein